MGALVCLLGLRNTLGFPAFAQQSGAEVLESSPKPLTVALLKSDYTPGYPEAKWRYEQIIPRWQALLSEIGIEYELITDTQLEKGMLEEFTVLILPAALCLSEQERSSIRGFLNEGKGVVASSTVGARSQNGEWVGWGLLEELTDSKVADYLGKKPGVWITFVGDSPLSMGLGPGFRMQFHVGQQIGISRASRDAYWSDWGRYPRRITKESHSDVAVIHGSYGKGRTVWFGFTVTEAIEDSLDQMALKRFLLNAILWTGRIPMSQAWYWPGSHQGAAIFVQDVEHQFENGENAAETLREEGVPGTFFCVSDLAIDNQALVTTFAEIGEVGSHSDDHQVFKGQPFDLQLRRMKKSISDLERMTDVQVKGLHPPQELWDEKSSKAWATVGGEYIYGNPSFRQLLPELVTIEKSPSKGLNRIDTLVVIPRTVRDDYDFLIKQGLTDKEEILRLHKLDFEKIWDVNGLYTFSYHSHLLASPDNVGILASLVKYAKMHDLWFTTAEEVCRWWKMRKRVFVETHMVSDDCILLSTRNLNSESIAHLSVVVYLPRTPKTVEISSDSSDVPSPRRHLEESKLVVEIETLKPNSIQTYTIKLR